MKVLIIDDEKPAREYLESIIVSYFADLEVVGSAKSVLEGIKILKTTAVDLVFLDVEMPHIDGFDFLELIPETKSKIIFTTAHEKYAVKAFSVRADGYLLKPVDVDDLTDLINHLFKPNTDTNTDTKIAFHTQTRVEYVDKNEIIRAEGEGNYTTIYLVNNDKIVVSKNLKEVEKLLPDMFFIKTHQSHIVNKSCIVRFIKIEGGHFEMTDNSTVPVSRRNKKEVLNQLNFQL